MSLQSPSPTLSSLLPFSALSCPFLFFPLQSRDQARLPSKNRRHLIAAKVCGICSGRAASTSSTEPASLSSESVRAARRRSIEHTWVLIVDPAWRKSESKRRRFYSSLFPSSGDMRRSFAQEYLASYPSAAVAVAVAVAPFARPSYGCHSACMASSA